MVLELLCLAGHCHASTECHTDRTRVICCPLHRCNTLAFIRSWGDSAGSHIVDKCQFRPARDQIHCIHTLVSLSFARSTNAQPTAGSSSRALHFDSATAWSNRPASEGPGIVTRCRDNRAALRGDFLHTMWSCLPCTCSTCNPGNILIRKS